MTLAVLQSVYKKDNPLFLDQSLASIACQTRRADKIVLVEDGALTAELDSVISRWKGRLPITVAGYNENRGLAHALNFGLRFVDTDLVARMDSDDISLPERFEKQVCAFEIDEDLLVLGGGIQEFYVGADGKSFERERLYPKRTEKNSPSLYKGTPLAHPTVMTKTSLLKKFGYSENTKNTEDIDLWFRLLGAGVELRALQEVLLRFRITDGTFRRRGFSKAWSEFRIYFANLLSFNGIGFRLALPAMRFASRLLPSALNRRLYFSQKRGNLFKENFMEVKTFQNTVFCAGGHIFQALVEFEENGKRVIKARQLDTRIENIVEVAADSVELCAAPSTSEVRI